MNPLTKHTLITQSEDTAPMLNQEQQRSTKRGGCKYPFPQRLFDLLEKADDDRREPENLSISSIISWSPNGKYFRVHNRKAFEDVIQKKHFNQSKYASFRRQLNLWGFERIPDHEEEDPSARSLYGGCHFHPLFQRHDRSLCCTMSRAVGRNGSKNTTIMSTGNNRSFGTHRATGRSGTNDAHVHDDLAFTSSLSTMEKQPFFLNPISVSPPLSDGLDGLEPYSIHHDSMKQSFTNQDDTTMIDADTLLSLLNNSLPQEDSHLIPLGEEFSLDQPQPDKGDDSSSSTTDDKEFQELITFLSANDDNIQKYLFES